MEPGIPLGGYPVQLEFVPEPAERNRLTTLFRIFLAIPHLILVGAPMSATIALAGDRDYSWGNEGIIGAIAGICSLIGWFTIVFGGSLPRGLADFMEFFLRWRVRACAYVALLSDKYPPFGEGEYPFQLALRRANEPRDRLGVAFRIFLVIPHFLVLALLGVVWCVVGLIAWIAILITGRYPQALYELSISVLRWDTRVGAYLLLLVDEYPPFSMEP